MISYSRELPKPKSEAEFEEMCGIVYGEVFGDLLPKVNGRRGQKQAGVDIYVRSKAGRVGVQCKRYKDGSLTFKHVSDEVKKAEAGPVQIVTMIVATTAASDAKLLAEVAALSDEREAAGLFAVQIEFWDDIRLRVAKSPTLQALYDPNAPGALFQKVIRGQEGLAQTMALMSQEVQVRQTQVFDTALPGALESSVSNAFTRQIDSIKELLEKGRYREANDRLEILATSFSLLDQHQKARWHVQRAVCRIHLFQGKGAAADLIAASEMYPQDEKMVAAGIRGLALEGKLADAIAAGTKAIREWPASIDIWTAFGFARLQAGERLNIDDVPSEMVSERRVVALLCWAAIDAGESALAVSYGRKLLALPEPSLSEKTAALTAALTWATQDPVARDLGFIEADARDALVTAVDALEPRSENIWKCQSLASVPADASNLCYAYYLLDRYDDVLGICAEAPGYIALPKRMASLKLVALKALGRVDELLDLVPRNLDEIEDGAIPAIAEVASWRGRVDLVQQLAEHVKSGDVGYDKETILALSAMAMLNAGQREEAVRAVAEVRLQAGQSLGAALVAARVLLAAGEKDVANSRIDEVMEALSDSPSEAIGLMLADCLFFLKRYGEAAAMYQPYCIPGHISLLHTRLLTSYVESGQRARARNLLATFPAGWTEDDEAREAAILLAQRAADWPRLLELAKNQLVHRPDSAGSWLLRLIAERHGGSKQVFLNLLTELPAVLKGPVRQHAQLAALQLQYGHGQAGVRRLYRMIRTNMNDPNAASAYMTCMFMRGAASDITPVNEVVPGTTVRMVDDSGVPATFHIDPEDFAGLPQHVDFHAPDEPTCSYLYGAQPGARIEIPGPFGATRGYTVASIEPVYLSILRTLQERVHSSPDGLPAIWSVNLRSQDGAIDLSEMAVLLGRSGESARNVFETYAANPISVGVCAKVLGVSALELVQGWPGDGPPLRVCEGEHSEREDALRTLEGDNVRVVVDLATLAQLVALDCEAALSSCGKMYLSTAAVHTLDVLVESAQEDRSIGRAANIGGEVRFIEFGEQYKGNRLRFLEQIKTAIKEHCIVQPAYGTGDAPDRLADFEEVLGEDEYEALLLANELGAVLLSVDLVLRQLGATLGIRGVWPQPFLANAAMKKFLPVERYRFATQVLFRSNQTFISVEPEDILLMCRQGGATLRNGLEKIRTVFQSPQSDPLSCTNVVEGVIKGVMRGKLTLGVIRELVQYLYEPLFRHPGHLPDLEARALRLMGRITNAFSAVPAWMPVRSAKLADASIMDGVRKFLEDGVRVALRRAAEPVMLRPFPFEITKVSVVPELRLARPGQPEN